MNDKAVPKTTNGIRASRLVGIDRPPILGLFVGLNTAPADLSAYDIWVQIGIKAGITVRKQLEWDTQFGPPASTRNSAWHPQSRLSCMGRMQQEMSAVQLD